MKINLHMIAEDLKDLDMEISLRSDRLERKLVYTQFYLPGMRIEEDCLYLAEAGMVPELSSLSFTPSFIIVGDFFRDLCSQQGNFLILRSRITLSALLNRVNRVFAKYSQWEQRLLRAIATNMPLSELGTLSEPLFQNPLEFMDINYRCIFQAATGVNYRLPESYWLTKPGDNMIPLEEINEARNSREFMDALHTKVPTLFSSDVFGDRCIFTNIYVHNIYSGRLIMDEVDGKITDRDYALLDILAGYIQLAMEASPSGEGDSVRHLSHLIRRMLGGEQPNLNEIASYLERSDWQVTDRYFCLVVTHQEKDDEMNASVALGAALSLYLADNTFLVQKDQIFFVVNLTRSGMTRQEVYERIVPELRDSLLKAGISTPFPDFSLLSQYYFQCCEALRIGSKKHPMFWYFRFEDYMLPYMLENSKGPLSPPATVHPKLYRLMEYDEKTGSRLCELLRVYLENNMSTIQTAQKLYIHKNTFLYRIAKVKEIVDLDFTDPDVRLMLLLQLRLVMNGPA